jgi:hypothetical protein
VGAVWVGYVIVMLVGEFTAVTTARPVIGDTMTVCPRVIAVAPAPNDPGRRVIDVVEPVAPVVVVVKVGVIVVTTVINVTVVAVTDVMGTSVPGISKKDGVLRKSA